MGRKKKVVYEKYPVTDYAYEVREKVIEVDVPESERFDEDEEKCKPSPKNKTTESVFATNSDWNSLSSNTDLNAALNKGS